MNGPVSAILCLIGTIFISVQCSEWAYNSVLLGTMSNTAAIITGTLFGVFLGVVMLAFVVEEANL